MAKDWLIRKISIALLYQPLEWTKLTPNQITILNFSIFGVSAVFSYSRGWNLLGLFFCIIHAGIDYIDGTLARRKFGGSTELGKWIDTSLDWLYYMLLIAGISYGINNLLTGLLCIIALTFGNYVDHNRPHINIKMDSFPYSPIIFIILGSILNRMAAALYLITIFLMIKAGVLWITSLKKQA